MVLLAVVTIAGALPLASAAVPVPAVSAALFGSGFLAVSAAATALIGHHRPQGEWSRTLAGFTTMFAIGQATGPALTGYLADHVGLRGGLTAATALLALATTAAWRQHAGSQPKHRPRPWPRSRGRRRHAVLEGMISSHGNPAIRQAARRVNNRARPPRHPPRRASALVLVVSCASCSKEQLLSPSRVLGLTSEVNDDGRVLHHLHFRCWCGHTGTELIPGPRRRPPPQRGPQRELPRQRPQDTTP